MEASLPELLGIPQFPKQSCLFLPAPLKCAPTPLKSMKLLPVKAPPIATILMLAFCLAGFSTVAVESTLAAGKYPAQPLKKKKVADPKSGDKKADAKKPEEKKKFDDEKSFNDVTKDMEVIKGLFTFYRNVDNAKLYMEIQTNQLDEVFLFSGSIEQSVGERGLYSAQMGGHFPFYFRLVGKNLQWVVKNTTFTAEKGTPAERATKRSFPNSILASAKVISQPHSERKSYLINVSDLILSDIPGFAPALKEAFKPSDYRFDKGSSSIAGVKAFPENTLFTLWLNYVSDQPKVNAPTVPDERSIQVVVKYDFSSIKDTGYRPRFADDRVGHFLTLQEDFTSDRPSSPFVRRIHRWNLEKADPNAELSAPKKPIVFWLENTIPVEYREYMKQGALLWNKAFERIGIKDAIEVKQQPDDADWDPADSRYNTIRWFAGIDASFAIGPSRANPFTGEIYDADIGFSEGIIRSVRRMGEEFAGPVLPLTAETPSRPKLLWDKNEPFQCEYANGLAEQAAFGVSVLDARGSLTPQMEDKLMHEYLVEVTAHEVGHTLGLRHNFRASTLLKPEQLLDDKITDELSQSGSVMDYNPIMLASKGQKQGHFVPTQLGPYDYWAIEYAYKQFPGDEAKELAKLAAKSADPQLGYSTDEDALGTYSASAIDPLVNQFDQSSDPLAYFETRIGIVHELWSNMEKKLIREGEGYQVLRRALVRGINEYYRGLLTASKFIGGIYHYRDHFGDPNGRTPYAPVSAAKQREALQFMQKYAFSEEAFSLPAELYNKMAIERLPGLDGNAMINGARLDYPWHDSVLGLQKAVLGRLFQNVTLSRLEDNELRFEAKEERFKMAEMFSALESSIWSELEKPTQEISGLRRNIQREHLKNLIRLTTRATGGVPEDATSLARASLKRIEEKIDRRLSEKIVNDATSIAHLEETKARIHAALEAQVSRNWE
jgi:hypothetical protein